MPYFSKLLQGSDPDQLHRPKGLFREFRRRLTDIDVCNCPTRYEVHIQIR